jgi:iron complex outermembrane receptor protein
MPAWKPYTALLVAGCLFAAPAWADPRDDARRHFAAGLEAANDGDYAIALQHFLAAQNAYAHPATLYNIARAYADMDDPANALSYYRQYQDAAPDKAADVQAVVDGLEARLRGDPVNADGTVAAVPRASAADLARLDAIAGELQALRERLAAVPKPEEPLDDPDGDPSPTDPTDTEGFLSDAYERQVVTASRVGQDPLDSPSTISVVTAEQLRLSGAISLPDALRRVAGIDVMSLASGHQDVSIRGFNRELNNKVLVLIDGRSTYLDFLGATLWSTLPVTFEEIERIEVIRGPGSAVYGANAVTGVINIITRTPGEEPRTVFRAIGGTTAYGRGSAYTTGRRGATSYRLAGGYQQIGRWAQATVLDPEDPGSPLAAPLAGDGDLGLRVLRGSARVDRTLGERGFLSLSAGIAEVETLDFLNIGALGNFVGEGQSHHFVRADVGYDVLHARVFWNHDDGITGPYTTPTGARDLSARYRTDTVDLEVEAPLAFTTGPVDHVLNLGLGYRRLDARFGYLEGGFDKPYAQNFIRGFINEEATIGRVKAVGSLRLDQHPLLDLDQTISPRAAVIVRLFENTSVRATAGTAFRQPTNIESFMDLALPTTADGAFIRDLGNTSLAPERITTLEVGVHDQSTYFHEADLVLFYNQVRNLIFLDDVTPTIRRFDPVENGYLAGTTGWVNLDEVYDAVGMEADVHAYPVDGLDLSANVALTSIQESAPDGSSVRDESTSLVKANLGVAYRTPFRLDVSGDVHFVSAQTWRLRDFDASGNLAIEEATIPARTLLNLRMAARPLPDEQLELAVGIWNALGSGPIDQRVREHPKGQPIRDVAYAEVTYAF